GMRIQAYDDQLLHLAEDLAQRLLPAFNTPTGFSRFRSKLKPVSVSDPPETETDSLILVKADSVELKGDHGCIPFGSVNLMHGVDENESKVR
ncbi:hypothetical protein Taro_038004, partial [Colocasia esculenta]|nr:hypothetical protein [Colocasia esculenta]